MILGNIITHTTKTDVIKFKSWVFNPKPDRVSLPIATIMNRRYTIEPMTTDSVITHIFLLGSKASPKITAAKPNTIVPKPALTSAPPATWANKAPAIAIKPLENAMPSTTMKLVEMPCARAIRGLAPVARMAKPVSVLKNQFNTNLISSVISSSTAAFCHMPLPNTGVNRSKMVFCPNSDTFGASPIRKLMEYSAVITIIPANSCKIPSFTCSHAVNTPAAAPAAKPIPMAKTGWMPAVMATAQANAPNGKLPSAVKSGKSSTRNDSNTPNATRAYTKPVSNVPKRASKDILYLYLSICFV